MSGEGAGHDAAAMTSQERAALAPLDDQMLADLAAVGEERFVERGDVLYRAGDDVREFFVVLEGEVEVTRHDAAGDVVVATRGANGFLGELNLLTGQRPYLTAQVSKTGRVLVVPPDRFRELMSTKPDLSDTIFRAFVARRELLRSCGGSAVIVVGGGNSAGQAAIFLAQQGSPVSLVIRRRDLAATMSQYLIARIAVNPRIEVLVETEVRAVKGTTHIEHVTVEHTPSGQHTTIECQGLFCFIGAVPATAWLDGAVMLDRSGFVLTDRFLPDDATPSPDFAGRDPLPFETSVPGVFAVGDVRHGSMKRVASAVGEGSSAVRSVIDYLATHA